MYTSHDTANCLQSGGFSSSPCQVLSPRDMAWKLAVGAQCAPGIHSIHLAQVSPERNSHHLPKTRWVCLQGIITAALRTAGIPSQKEGREGHQTLTLVSSLP